MSKIVHPYAHRLVILRDWRSRWFQVPKKYKDFLKTDIFIREFLQKKLRGFYIGGVEIERRGKSMKLIIRTSRPGMLIGKSGEGIEKLKKDMAEEMKRKKIAMPEDFKIEVMEVPVPDADANVIAYSIAEGLEKRLPFRRVLKQVIEKVMASRIVSGVRIKLSGRLGGAEISRSEELKKGSIPLQTFRADVDFARERAHLPYGDLGIKVWIYKGEIFNKK
jgi:small subunit ribosomal protein S3